MQNYDDLVAQALTRVPQIMPWDLSEMLAAGKRPLLLDVREASEFALLHLAGAINVPRGVLEQSCEWDYEETVPSLAAGRETQIVVICRNGKRSALAGDVLLKMGFKHVVSLNTGVRGWNDFEQALVDGRGAALDGDAADALLAPQVQPQQRRPKGHA